MRTQSTAIIVLACGLLFSALAGATRVEISDEEIKIQDQAYPAALSYYEALQKAIASFLYDDDEGPIATLKHKFLSDAEARNVLDILMNESDTVLTMVTAADTVAPRGESLDKNWIFRLHIDLLSDHSFYAIVDRYEGVPAYNYGFN